MNKKLKLAVALNVATGLVGFATIPANALVLGFDSTAGSNIAFNGHGGFAFSANDNFTIVTSDFIADSINDIGSINGNFNVGQINGNQASVTGTGSLIIHGITGFDLSATFDWKSIGLLGTTGGLNLNGEVNLTHVNFGGPFIDMDLNSLATELNPSIVLQFSTLGYPTTSLNTLVNGGKVYTSPFSGQIDPSIPNNPTSTPDSGMTFGLAGFAMLAVEGLRRKMAK